MGGFAGHPPIVTDGLVFYVDAGNSKSYPGTGTTWTDMVGSNNGTLTNGPTFSSSNGGSIVFDDSDDISIHGSSNDITGNNLQTLTFNAWFKASSTDNGYISTVKRLSTDSTLITLHSNVVGSGQLSAGHIGFMTRSYDNTAHDSLTDNNNGNGWNYGQWHYVTAVVNGLTRILYIDGIQKASDSTFGMQSVTGNTANFTIGGFNTSNTSALFGGNIANVSFYRRALSSSEILQNYNALKNRFI